MNINATRLTVGELLKDGKIYSIPIFQRSYSWEKQHISDFWIDLIDLCESEEKDKDYFIGSMVFTPHEVKNKIKILDGQQRFATILLLLSSLRDILKQSTIEGGSDWIEEINRIIYTIDVPKRVKHPKLELNKDDKIFFDKVVIDGNIQASKPHSHKLIREAYIFFKDKISGKLDETKEKFVESILDAIINKLLMIKIEVDSDDNANMIFETLNDRGLELSVGNLVRNYICSISASDLESVIQIWEDIVDQVGDYNVTRFLRHFWISSHELVRKEDLYKKLKNKVNTKNVKDFMELLYEEAAIYSNLNTPTHEFWADPEIESMIDELNILKVEQIYILLLALFKKFYDKKDSFKKLLKTLINFIFRYNTICGLDPKVLERLYSDISVRVRKGEVGENEVIKEIAKLSPSKEQFIAAFRDIEISYGKLAKYILLKINNYMMIKQDKKEITTNVNEVNLEHVIPRKPDKEWEEFFKRNDLNKEELIYRIGNMTILYKEYNRKIANKFFDKKKEMYVKSQLPLNERLKEYKEFGIKEVKERQQEIGVIAEELWKV